MECKVEKIDAAFNDLRRFNRYIVECKVMSSDLSDVLNLDLIDTLWNVKKIPGLISAMSNPI